MPNGGSDCCGTCVFNHANRNNRPTESWPQPVEPAHCTIRDLAIENPYWTYCANHPHHNPDLIAVPVGPVLVCDSYPYTRRVWVSSPDTETIRTDLVGLLERFPEVPQEEYPSETQFDEAVIDQLAVFREPRAVPGLRRVIRFDPQSASPDERFGRTRAVTVGRAVEALASIVGDEALGEIERCLDAGLADVPATIEYVRKNDPLAAVRYHAVRAIEHCRSQRSLDLLRRSLNDPNPDIRAFATEIFARREKTGG
jgi:hypothetical protein